MSSAAKIAANRENAHKSTGPRSERGKSKSRLNALKFGIHATTPVLPGEDADAYREIVKSNLKHFVPVGPVENMLVRQLTIEQWRLHRIERAENALHVRLKEGQIVRFLGSLDTKETAYVRSAYADELREEIRQSQDELRAKLAELVEEARIVVAGNGIILPEFPQKTDENAKEDVEARLSRILEPDNTLLEVLVRTTESAPQTYFVQERRTAMRAYMAYAEKLRDLQEARLTVTLSPRPQITGTGKKRTNAKRSQQVLSEEAANQNQSRPDNEVPGK